MSAKNNQEALIVKVESEIVFNLIMSPIMFTLGYFAFNSETSDNESFLPFMFLGIGLFIISIYSIFKALEVLYFKYEYAFYIETKKITIIKYSKKQELQRYEIDRCNLKSFDFSTNKTTDITTITFILNDETVVRISENFGKKADDIFEEFLLNGYVIKRVLDLLSKNK